MGLRSYEKSFNDIVTYIKKIFFEINPNNSLKITLTEGSSVLQNKIGAPCKVHLLSGNSKQKNFGHIPPPGNKFTII